MFGILLKVQKYNGFCLGVESLAQIISASDVSSGTSDMLRWSLNPMNTPPPPGERSFLIILQFYSFLGEFQMIRVIDQYDIHSQAQYLYYNWIRGHLVRSF